MNKKGQSGDFLSIGYFMFLLFIIGATIFLMAKLVLGVAYDARLTEASLLSHKIEKCLSEGDLKESQIASIEKTCGIKLTDAEGNARMYILQISVAGDKIFTQGDIISCGFYELNKKNARCVSFTTLGKLNGEEVEFNVVAGSNIQSEVDK
jgi:hypothetical protein